MFNSYGAGTTAAVGLLHRDRTGVRGFCLLEPVIGRRLGRIYERNLGV